VPAGLTRAASGALATHLRWSCETQAERDVPREALDASGRRASSRSLLGSLLDATPPQFEGIVAITAIDLYVPAFTFVFGEAQIGGRAAVASLFRLREELYLRPPDPALLERRLSKEVLHEAGHLCGLAHCREAECVMSQSCSPGDVDAKPLAFCGSCRAAAGG